MSEHEIIRLTVDAALEVLLDPGRRILEGSDGTTHRGLT